MRRIVVHEHGQVIRWSGADVPATNDGPVYLAARLYDRLKRFDQQRQDDKDRVFAWGDGYARAQQWVGVIQVHGLQVEVLPKVDPAVAAGGKQEQHETRRNLLYMLAVAGDVPVRSRDLARLASRKAPLSETLVAIFADRLLQELLRGPERAYLSREANLRRFKGKLLVPSQLLHNPGRRERFYCRFEEFAEDTPLNQVFRAACRLLLDATRTPGTQDLLRNCLLLLDQVADVPITPNVLDGVVITRQNERFADVYRFCLLILAGRSPTVRAGEQRSFSLLFDMNKVFERFIAAFLRTRVIPGLTDFHLFPQARHQQRHLMTQEGKGVLALRPDLLIRGPANQLFVIDTKWKKLTTERARGGVGAGDLYQLYAYTRRYGCTRSMLLFPSTAGAEPKQFEVLGADGSLSGEEVLIRQVNLHRDLHQEAGRQDLENELRELVLCGFAPTSVAMPATAGGGGA